MLAVTANWTLTDGTLTPSRSALAEDWLNAVRQAVVRAGFRRDGRYRPVESICLVFAGDTFDWLLSDAWSGRDRPWHGGRRGMAARAAVATATLREVRPVVAALRRWIRRGVPLPRADARGRPFAGALWHAPLRVVILAGDRDAWVGESMNAARSTTGRVGVLVGESWSDGRVSIRHGHDLDPLCHAAMVAPGVIGRAPTLAESLTVDLLVPFAMAVRSEPAGWSLVRARMRMLAAAPLAELPRAVAKLLGVGDPATAVSRRLRNVWRHSVEDWTARARREPPVCEAEHDLLDAVAAWLDTAGHDVDATVPSAIARLGSSVPRSPGGITVLGHGPESSASVALPGSGSPLLAVFSRDDGPGTVEALGHAAAGPSVVSIGAVAGSMIVEAA